MTGSVQWWIQDFEGGGGGGGGGAILDVLQFTI